MSSNKEVNVDKQKTKERSRRALNAPPCPRDTVCLPLEGTIVPSPFQPLPVQNPETQGNWLSCLYNMYQVIHAFDLLCIHPATLSSFRLCWNVLNVKGSWVSQVSISYSYGKGGILGNSTQHIHPGCSRLFKLLDWYKGEFWKLKHSWANCKSSSTASDGSW